MTINQEQNPNVLNKWKKKHSDFGPVGDVEVEETVIEPSFRIVPTEEELAFLEETDYEESSRMAARMLKGFGRGLNWSLSADLLDMVGFTQEPGQLLPGQTARQRRQFDALSRIEQQPSERGFFEGAADIMDVGEDDDYTALRGPLSSRQYNEAAEALGLPGEPEGWLEEAAEFIPEFIGAALKSPGSAATLTGKKSLKKLPTWMEKIPFAEKLLGSARKQEIAKAVVPAVALTTASAADLPEWAQAATTLGAGIATHAATQKEPFKKIVSNLYKKADSKIARQEWMATRELNEALIDEISIIMGGKPLKLADEVTKKKVTDLTNKIILQNSLIHNKPVGDPVKTKGLIKDLHEQIILEMGGNRIASGSDVQQKAVDHIINKLFPTINRDATGVREVLNLKQSLYKDLQTIDNKVPGTAERLGGAMDAIFESLKKHGKRNPEWWKAQRLADTAHKGVEESKKIFNNIGASSLLKTAINHSPLGLLLHYSGINVGVAAGILVGASAFKKMGQVVKTLEDNPGLRKVYMQFLRDAHKGNLRGSFKAAELLNSEIRKRIEWDDEDVDVEEKRPSKKPYKRGFTTGLIFPR